MMGDDEEMSDPLDLDSYPRYPIQINAFEVGVLITAISENKKIVAPLGKVMDQLRELMQKFRDEAGVEIERTGDIVTIKDRAGNRITRPLYEWEK